MISLLLLCLAVCFLAYSNGANDNFKGVASLFGSGTANHWTAIVWATATTFAPSIAAIFLAELLVKKFSGKGLVPDVLTTSPQFIQGFAANLSTAALVTPASFHGMPVSTTHVSVGALLGRGIATRQTKWKPVLGVLASWVVSLQRGTAPASRLPDCVVRFAE